MTTILWSKDEDNIETYPIDTTYMRSSEPEFKSLLRDQSYNVTSSNTLVAALSSWKTQKPKYQVVGVALNMETALSKTSQDITLPSDYLVRLYGVIQTLADHLPENTSDSIYAYSCASINEVNEYIAKRISTV